MIGVELICVALMSWGLDVVVSIPAAPTNSSTVSSNPGISSDREESRGGSGADPASRQGSHAARKPGLVQDRPPPRGDGLRLHVRDRVEVACHPRSRPRAGDLLEVL